MHAGHLSVHLPSFIFMKSETFQSIYITSFHFYQHFINMTQLKLLLHVPHIKGPDGQLRGDHAHQGDLVWFSMFGCL